MTWNVHRNCINFVNFTVMQNLRGSVIYRRARLKSKFQAFKRGTVIAMVFFLLVNITIDAQNEKISGNFSGKTLKEVFSLIESQSTYRFFFNENFINTNKVVNMRFNNESIEQVLKKLFRGLEVRYEIKESGLIVLSTESDKKNLRVYGRVTDRSGNPLPGVATLIKGTTIGTITDIKGNYSLNVNDGNASLSFSFIGMQSQEILIANNENIDVVMLESPFGLGEIIAVGYGTMKKGSITGAISSIKDIDIDQTHATTVSTSLAGKMAGISYRMSDGRPGSSASIQIRNMGSPLYVIDGIPKDVGQFNNIAPNDIESISVLKDASAAVYGVRAANGVIVVTTKRGKKRTENHINVDAYMGWQNWSRFPQTVNAYQWMLGKADAEMNEFGQTSITPEELARWKKGTENGYKSFDWYDFIIQKNSPQKSINVNTTGGSDRISYYLSFTQLDQNSVLGDEFIFNRSNIQSNIDIDVTNRFQLGMQLNGRVEKRDYPGVPGTDDYWAPIYALFRNRPTERPYANDNPNYINNIGHNSENWALLNKDLSGYWNETWRVVQVNLTGEYEFPVKGLTAKATYSYYFADRLMDGHEYTYDTYTYYPENPEGEQYVVTFSMQNPWRERGTRKVIEDVTQLQLNYHRRFGTHDIKATFVNERLHRRDQSVWVHAVPTTNDLTLIQFEDMDTYDDGDSNEARIGYVGRINYNYANKYYLELSGRMDGSWKFAPDVRWGFFPSVSAGWMITEEPFVKSILNESLFDLKLRLSYGELGDDDIAGLGAFDYLSGYTYGSSTVIMDGNVITGVRDKGEPITNITWYTSKIIDAGADFTIDNGKVNGSVDFFRRKRDGLRGSKYDILIPSEIGYNLPDENVSSDAIIGGEFTLAYNGKLQDLKYTIGGNFSFAREKFLHSYKPKWGNSWDYYRNSSEERWTGVFWGYEVEGQFQSMEEINNYDVDIDGYGNSTLLPGDLIYKDTNGDKIIDYRDVRPMGYPNDRNPAINFGLNFSSTYKGFDLRIDFSGGALYSYNQLSEMRVPYQSGGNLLKVIYEDRWHHEDPFDVNSAWIPGKYPALRFNNGSHSNYYRNSTFWLTNVYYLRMRTLELGYSIPKTLLKRVGIEKCRVYLNTYNLFSIDNLKKIGIDPETMSSNGVQYPQNKIVNIGVNLSF